MLDWDSLFENSLIAYVSDLIPFFQDARPFSRQYRKLIFLSMNRDPFFSLKEALIRTLVQDNMLEAFSMPYMRAKKYFSRIDSWFIVLFLVKSQDLVDLVA